MIPPYPLLARFRDVLLGLKKLADIQGLAPPEVPVDTPVEGELQ